MVLSASHLETLRAAMDRIVPADEHAGAWDAGCGEFLNQLLEQGLADAALYRGGLDGLESEAQRASKTSFSALSPELQDDLLAAVEAGSIQTAWAVSPGAFFRTLVRNTMEGYYGNAANGGLREAETWKAIGFEVKG